MLEAQGSRQISFAAAVRQEAVAIAAAFSRQAGAERLSSRYDGGHERDLMLNGIDKLQRVFAEAGFAPR